MAATLYEETFGRKFNPPPYSLKALFEDFERVKNESDTTLWRLLIDQSLDFYQSNLKWGTLEDVISVYADEPALSGHATPRENHHSPGMLQTVLYPENLRIKKPRNSSEN